MNFITQTQPNYCKKKNSKLNPTLRLDQVGFGGLAAHTMGDGGFEHWKSTLEH